MTKFVVQNSPLKPMLVRVVVAKPLTLTWERGLESATPANISLDRQLLCSFAGGGAGKTASPKSKFFETIRATTKTSSE